MNSGSSKGYGSYGSGEGIGGMDPPVRGIRSGPIGTLHSELQPCHAISTYCNSSWACILSKRVESCGIQSGSLPNTRRNSKQQSRPGFSRKGLATASPSSSVRENFRPCRSHLPFNSKRKWGRKTVKYNLGPISNQLITTYNNHKACSLSHIFTPSRVHIAALIHMLVASSKVWKIINRQSAQLVKTPGSFAGSMFSNNA